METYISFETALLAQELEFTILTVGSHTYNYYKQDGTTGDINVSHLYLDNPAKVPQSILQKWLRDRYGLNLNIHWHGKYDFVIKFEPEKIVNERKKVYDTYEEALEEGLKASLKILLDRKNEEDTRTS